MDTSDPEIEFDADGVCNHCRSFPEAERYYVPRPEDRDARLAELVDRMKKAGRGRTYDCVIGLSGGVDSSYLAYAVKQLGLRPIAVHLDNSWDSELAVKNIENIVTRLGIDLVTYVLDWPEFRDLQVSFLKASVSDAEVPTDHAIVALMLKTAAERKIKYLIIGTNVVTEAILPASWTSGTDDWTYISAIQRQFGTRPLRKFPHYTMYEFAFNLGVRRIRWVRLLDLLDYDKAAAMATLKLEVEWRNYGGKHHESLYTKFFQGYILPRKFGIDKRRAHLSTLINSGQLSRASAVAVLATPPLDPSDEASMKEYVTKKLGLTPDEFEEIMNLPHRTYRDYPNASTTRERLLRLARFTRRVGLVPRINDR